MFICTINLKKFGIVKSLEVNSVLHAGTVISPILKVDPDHVLGFIGGRGTAREKKEKCDYFGDGFHDSIYK